MSGAGATGDTVWLGGVDIALGNAETGAEMVGLDIISPQSSSSSSGVVACCSMAVVSVSRALKSPHEFSEVVAGGGGGIVLATAGVSGEITDGCSLVSPTPGASSIEAARNSFVC